MGDTTIKLPAGYTLDAGGVTPPAGYTLDAAPEAPTPPEKTIGGFLGNSLTSAGRFVGDIAGAVAHPGRTLEGVTGLIEGMAEKSGFKPVAGVSHQQNVDALMNLYKERYGSVENLKNSLYTDPVGVLADVATLASGFGAGAKGVQLAADAAKLTKVADVAGTVAKGAEAVSAVTDPLKLAGKAATATGVPALIGKGADAASEALTRGALRGGFTVNTDASKVADAVQTMKGLGLPLSEKGSQQITAALQDLQKEKLDKLLTGTVNGKTIDPKRVELRLNDLENEYRMQVNPDADLKQIQTVRDNFRRGNPGPITVDDAEALKEGTYAQNKYGDKVPAHLTATSDAEKALARGLKEELEAQLPELTALNQKQASLMNLQGILDKAVNKYANSGGFLGHIKKEMFSRTGLEIGGAAGIASHDPGLGVAAATLQAVLSDPAVKQRLAIAINQAQQLNPGKYGKPSMATALSRVNEYASSLNPQQ